MALASGFLYDRVGARFLSIPFALSILPIASLLIEGLLGIILACISIGLVLGMQESIYRAAVADIVPLGSRGSAYGIFNVMLGVGTFIGGTVFGVMLDVSASLMLMLSYVTITQVIAIILLLKTGHPKREPF